jgi:hypothetical protein
MIAEFESMGRAAGKVIAIGSHYLYLSTRQGTQLNGNPNLVVAG